MDDSEHDPAVEQLRAWADDLVSRTNPLVRETVVVRRRWLNTSLAAGLVAAAAIAAIVVVQQRSGAHEVGRVSPPSTSAPPVTDNPVSTTTAARPAEVAGSVSSEISAPLKPEVIYSAGVGDGINELGLEPGNGESLVPWAPLFTHDGLLVIADVFNRRWVVVSAGQATAAPFPPDSTVDGQPLLGPDGQVYAPLMTTTGTPPVVKTEYSVAVFSTTDLALPTASYPLTSGNYSLINFDGNDLLESGWRLVATIGTVDETLPRTTELDNHTMMVTNQTVARTWTFPDSWSPDMITPLRDGSVVMRVNVTGGPPATFFTRLWPDGSSESAPIDGINYALNGSTTITPSGILQMELHSGAWTVVRYTLPGATLPNSQEPPTSSTTASTLPTGTTGALDIGGGTMFGFAPSMPANPDDVIIRLQQVIGTVTWDTQWQPMPEEFACTGNDMYRTMWWGDLRFTFENSPFGTLLTAWSLGEGQVLAPLGPLPDAIGPATGITTDEGVGIGSAAAEVSATVGDQMIGTFDGGIQVVSSTGLATIVSLDGDQRIVGIGSSRNDCGSGENDGLIWPHFGGVALV